jgi:glycosidase
MIADAGIEPILRAWIILDNHDTRRLRTMLPDETQRRMAQVLQFTLPGAPCIYYGVELGMTGGDDPEMRGPMRWDLVNEANPELGWMRKLIDLRRANRALRIGDFRWLGSEKLLAFQRRTDDVAETIIVAANPTDEPVTEVITTRDSRIMNWTWLENMLGDGRAQVMSGLVTLSVPPRTAWVLRPGIEDTREYSSYKRVRGSR